MKFPLNLLVVIIIMTSCQPASMQSSQVSQEQDITFTTKTISEKTGDCEAGGDAPCMKVTLKCLFAEEGPESTVSFINQTLKSYYLEAFGPEQNQDTSLTELAKAAIKDYEDVVEEMPEFTTNWEIDQNSELLFKNGRVATVQINNSTYLGGAHPNYYEALVNLDVKEEMELTGDDLFQDTTKIKQLAEQAFKKERELDEDANLNEEGFFWDEAFKLPEHIGFTQKGLIFVYNPYEAAPYAAGMTVFTIPYSDLQGIVKKEYLFLPTE